MFIAFFEDGNNISNNTFFQSFRNVLVSRHRLKIISRGLQIELLQSFSILILIWSWTGTLLGSKVWINFAISSLEKITDDKRLCVKYSSLLGSSLLLLIREHWSAKKKLKSLVFLKINYKLTFVMQWWNDRYFFIIQKGFKAMMMLSSQSHDDAQEILWWDDCANNSKVFLKVRNLIESSRRCYAWSWWSI